MKGLKMYYDKFDHEVENFLVKEKSEGKIPACEKGCSDCCKNVPLLISPSEIDYIVAKLNTLNKTQQKNIAKNIKQLDKKYTVPPEKINTMEAIQESRAMQMNYQCPFLLGNNCAIYEARPMLCRGYMSSNKNLCKDGTGDMIFHMPEEIRSHYLDTDDNKIGNNLLRSHAHRSIEYKNGKFHSLTNILREKARKM